MKRFMNLYFFMIFLFLACLLLNTNCFCEEIVLKDQNVDFLPRSDIIEGTFILPRSLVSIEDEAFEGTNARNIYMFEHVSRIEARAFAYNRRLEDIYIPQETSFISDDAFEGNSSVTIHGILGSYADKWAKRHGLPFINDYMVYSLDGLKELLRRNSSFLSFVLYSLLPIIYKKRRANRNVRDGKSYRPQDRPELHEINYIFP